MKPPSSRRSKRLGSFKASANSRPTFTGEAPRVTAPALADLQIDSSHEAAGQEALGYIEDMLALAHQVATMANDGKVRFEPAGLWWENEDLLMQGLSADSARGFAIRMMLGAGPINARIMGIEPMRTEDSIFLVRDVLRFAAQYNSLRAEWVDGPDVAGARAAQVGRAEGGRQKARATNASVRRRRMAWQREAVAIWLKNPSLTKIAVARIIASRFKSDEALSSSAHTIRAVIRKPD